ncbi:MAG TPA: hypothetical protein VIM49_03455 [Dermatophilaceae bacterium]
MPRLVDTQPPLAVGDRVSLARLAAAAMQDRLDAQDDLGWAERFGDVVVRAELQAVNPVFDGASCCQDENRGVSLGMDLAEHLPDIAFILNDQHGGPASSSLIRRSRGHQ